MSVTRTSVRALVAELVPMESLTVELSSTASITEADVTMAAKCELGGYCWCQVKDCCAKGTHCNVCDNKCHLGC